MSNKHLHIDDLSENRTLAPEQLESIVGGRSGAEPVVLQGLLSSPLGNKYLPEPDSVWVREIVEDVEAY